MAAVRRGDVAVKSYRLAMRTPYRWSKGIQHHRAGLIVRVEIDGAVGWGEVALPPHVEVPDEALAQSARALADGLDPGRPDFLAELDLRECPARLRCGFSSAVHTARAAAAGKPLAAFLMPDRGALPGRVPVNDLIGDADPHACVARAAAAIARGQRTVKVKCTPERELDLTRVGAIRRAFADLAIRIDPNESWPVEWAADQLRAMAAFAIEYVEEPLPRGTPLNAYAELRRSQPIPVALDDSVRSIYHAERIIEQGAADIFILKAQRVGGPERLRDIVRLAEANGVGVTVTSSLETSVGLYLAVHCAALATPPLAPAGNGTARYYAQNVGPPPPIVDGFMALPAEPGLGFAPIDWWQRGAVVETASD